MVKDTVQCCMSKKFIICFIQQNFMYNLVSIAVLTGIETVLEKVSVLSIYLYIIVDNIPILKFKQDIY